MMWLVYGVTRWYNVITNMLLNYYILIVLSLLGVLSDSCWLSVWIARLPTPELNWGILAKPHLPQSYKNITFYSYSFTRHFHFYRQLIFDCFYAFYMCVNSYIYMHFHTYIHSTYMHVCNYHHRYMHSCTRIAMQCWYKQSNASCIYLYITAPRFLLTQCGLIIILYSIQSISNYHACIPSKEHLYSWYHAYDIIIAF